LIDSNNGGRLAVESRGPAIVLRAQFDTGHVLHVHHTAISGFAHNDVAELFRRLKPALGAYGICELLACIGWFASHLTGRICRVLRFYGIGNFADGNTQLRQLIGFHPQPHRVLADAVDLNLSYTVRAGNRLLEIDIAVVGQELRVVRPLWRIQRDQHHRRGQGLLHVNTDLIDLGRKLAIRQLLARLGEDEVHVRVGLDIKIDHQRCTRVVGRVQRVHVIHIVHAVDLLLDGRGYGLLQGLGVRPRVQGPNADFGGSDVRKLRDREADNGDRANDYHKDRDHDGNDRTLDEKVRHGSAFLSLDVGGLRNHGCSILHLAYALDDDLVTALQAILNHPHRPDLLAGFDRPDDGLVVRA